MILSQWDGPRTKMRMGAVETELRPAGNVDRAVMRQFLVVGLYESLLQISVPAMQLVSKATKPGAEMECRCFYGGSGIV
jgi:hypothetical protein